MLRQGKYVIIAFFGVLQMIAPSVTRAQILGTSSTNQLAISRATLDALCPAGTSDTTFGSALRTLSIYGENFDKCGNVPVVGIGWGSQLKTYSPNTWNGTSISATVNCSDFGASGVYRLQVWTGQGQVCWDGVTVNLNLRGPAGANGINGTNGATGPAGPTGPGGPTGSTGPAGKDGANGATGPTGPAGKDGANGASGPAGKDGVNGAPGLNGNNGKDGQNGKHGKGFRKVVIAPGATNNPCTNGASFAIYSQSYSDTLGTWVDDPITTTNPTYICHGRDGAPGQNGKAFGWHKKASSMSIGGTSTTVLSQIVTGTNAYMVDAKVNAPFGNNQTQITCVLVAVENGVSTEIDRLDTNLPGSSQNPSKGGIALDGAYTATGGAVASVTINLNCWTGGDARTLSHARMNVVGVDQLQQ